MGMSKAFSIPCADIEALLVNAGLYKKSAKGLMCFKARVWHLFTPSLPECIHICSIRKNVWYVARGALIHATPGQQQVARVRVSARAVLPADVLIQLRQSSKAYDDVAEKFHS